MRRGPSTSSTRIGDEQAYKEAKSYLKYTHFSREGLIEQLSSSFGSQFTYEEALYAVNKLGL